MSLHPRHSSSIIPCRAVLLHTHARVAWRVINFSPCEIRSLELDNRVCRERINVRVCVCVLSSRRDAAIHGRESQRRMVYIVYTRIVNIRTGGIYREESNIDTRARPVGERINIHNASLLHRERGAFIGSDGLSAEATAAAGATEV